MGQKTNIEWCDSTINGTSGCDGCELYRPDPAGDDETGVCYAMEVHLNRLARSFPHNYAPKFNQVRMIPGRFAQAAAWSDLLGKERADKPWLNGRPRHIFVGDMGDFLSAEVTDEYLENELLAAVKSEQGKRHVWLWLTKRPTRLAALSHKWGGLPGNVIAMTTVTTQRSADVRLPELMKVRCFRRGVSIEPMWSRINLKPWLPQCDGEGFPLTVGLNWGIAGGESGFDKRDASGGLLRAVRPLHPDWVRGVRDDFKGAGVPFLFKQWGAWAPFYDRDVDDPDWQKVPHEAPDVCRRNLAGGQGFHGERVVYFKRAGRKGGGRLLDGVEHNGMPIGRGAE